MAVIATISSSPSTTSRTDAVLGDLAAEPLLRAGAEHDDIARAACALERADAVIVSGSAS